MNENIKWLKEHIGVVAFLFTIFSALITFVVYLDTEQDVKLARQVLSPVIDDIHDEVLLNRKETLTNREHTIKLDEKINEIEKQTIRMETKIDTMIKMLEDGKKTK